jgi:hypothetical protein
MTTPQASDFQRGDVPMPIEARGKRSRLRTIQKQQTRAGEHRGFAGEG